jgi:hypothetical protein
LKVRPKLTVAMTPILVGLLLASSVEAGSGSCWDYRRPERRLARKINKARANHSIGAVKLDRHLSKVSRAHTRNMIERGSIFHTAPSVLAKRVTNWTVLAENVGRTTGNARLVFRRMMKSAAHKANILDGTFNHVGVATKRTKGWLWVTITFEATNNPGTTLSMPSC